MAGSGPMIQLKNMSNNSSNIRLTTTVQPREQQLLAVCLSSTTSATTSASECYYYSTLGKKTGWCSYENTMALKTMLSRPLNPSIQDMTPEFSLNLGLGRGGGSLGSCEIGTNQKNKGSSHKHSFAEQIFRNVPTNINRYLKIISPQEGEIWQGIITEDALFIRGNGLEHVDLKERIVAVIELAEELKFSNTLVVCLDNKLSSLSTLIRNLYYLGFELVTPEVYNHNSGDFILVGMEL